MTSKIAINGQRLWQSLMDLARIGATPKGGNARLALTALDGQGARPGLRLDARGRTERDRGPCGEHLRPPRGPQRCAAAGDDWQPYRYPADRRQVRRLLRRAGRAGSHAHAQRQRRDHRAPLELAIWTNEEGTRFGAGDDGLGRVRRHFPLETALSATDATATGGGRAQAIGYAGAAEVGGRQVGAYFEAHIEQGPVLEAADNVIGVVTGSLGLRWYDVTVTGMEAHAGPTPMPLRRDALFGATHVMQEVVHIANDFAPHGRGTVGVVNIHPARATSFPAR